MATIRQLKSGKWQVIIRKKNYPELTKSFMMKSLASKWAKMIETQMEKRGLSRYVRSRRYYVKAARNQIQR